MSAARYENELRGALNDAAAKLAAVDGFVLFALNPLDGPGGRRERNLCRDAGPLGPVRPRGAGVAGSGGPAAAAAGRNDLAALVDRALTRTDNPADFEYRGVVRVEHADWHEVVAGAEPWDGVEAVLTRLRHEAAVLVGRSLAVEPDAEISIGTRRDW